MKNITLILGILGIGVLLVFASGCTQEGGTAPTTTVLPTPPTTPSMISTTSPVSTATQSSIQTYENSYFSIQYPGSWVVKAAPDGNSVTFTSPLGSTDDNYQESMNVTRESISASPDQYSDAKLAAMQASVSNFNLILDSRINMHIGNLPARKVGFSGKVGTLNVQWIQIYVIKDTAAYVLTFAAKDPDFRNFVTARDAMFDSFTIK